MRRLTAYVGRRHNRAVAVQEPTFLILTALTAQPMHGYGLMQRVKELSESRVQLRTGTLYGALDRLMVEGLITGDREEVVDGRLRRYYRLTDEGAGVLAAEAERLERNVEAARAGLRQRAARPARPGLTTTFAADPA
jgi:PadR family transcriptional regulator, regulatory protein PadR